MTSEHPNLPDVAASLRADKAERQAATSGWFNSLVLLWLVLRAAGFVLRDASVDPWVLLGVLSDVVIVTALWKLSSAALAPRFFLAFAAFLRVIDLAHIAIDKAHFTVSTWGHVSLDLWRLLLEGGALVVLSFAVAAGWFAWRASAYSPPPAKHSRLWLAALLILSSAHWLAFPNPMHNALVSEINVIRTLQARFSGPEALGMKPLNAADRQACWDLFPVAATPPPAPATQTGVQHVVVIFVESLDANWLKRTPNAADTLQKKGFVLFSGFHTQARPTQFGLVASLCSLLPGSWPFDTRTDGKIPKRPCLPGHLEHALGMASAFVHGGYNSYTGLNTTLHQLGFQRVIGRRDLDPDGTTETNNPFALHDKDVFSAATKLLKDAEAKNQRQFIAVGTADSHFPGYIPAEHANSTVPESDRMATAMRIALLEATAFVTDLETAGLLEKTLVVITADHSAHASETDRLFGELTLAIRHPDIIGPKHKSTFGGQLDLAPTILDTLGLRARPDRFAGQSLWLEADENRVLLGITGRRVAEIRPSGEVVVPQAQLEGTCRTSGACRVIRCLNHLDGYWYGRHSL